MGMHHISFVGVWFLIGGFHNCEKSSLFLMQALPEVAFERETQFNSFVRAKSKMQWFQGGKLEYIAPKFMRFWIDLKVSFRHKEYINSTNSIIDFKIKNHICKKKKNGTKHIWYFYKKCLISFSFAFLVGFCTNKFTKKSMGLHVRSTDSMVDFFFFFKKKKLCKKINKKMTSNSYSF